MRWFRRGEERKSMSHFATPALQDSLRKVRKILFVALLLMAPMMSTASAQTLVSITVTQIYDKNGSSQLPVGANRQFTATGNYSDGTQQYITQQVTWSSTNNAIATVTSTMGLVTATGGGTVTINAAQGTIQGSSALTVINATLLGVYLTPPSAAMQAGISQQFTATAGYSGPSTQDVTQTATWKSSNPSVATVTKEGVVHAVAPGTASITAGYSAKSNSTAVTATSTAPPNLGQWSAPQPLGMLAIHAALLYTGQVLFWGYPIGRSGGPSPARLWNPATGAITDVTLPFPEDIFCAGNSILSDGRVFVAGGLDDTEYPLSAGTVNATIFDPGTSTWTQAPAMKYARYYPSTVLMPDGTVFTLSGTDGTGSYTVRPTESYNPTSNVWIELPKSAAMPPNPDLYPLMTVLPNGNVFYATPRQDSQMYYPATETWAFVANLNTAPREHAGAVLLPDSSKVMVVGGAQDEVDGLVPTSTTEIIDLSSQTPVWNYAAPLNLARYNHNLIYVADGTILAVGGNQRSKYLDPVEQPELYNSTANTWTLMAPQVGLRAYHSTAVLLPDGRVVSEGSDSGNPLEMTFEIYSPPYLFNGARPTISSAPSAVNYGAQFTIATPDAANVTRVALIRAGSTTHADHFDDQRYLNLTWTVGSKQITAMAPANSYLAPPGYYLLVILNSNNVPSTMPLVQLQQTATINKSARTR
jgi:Domain of unknown function (DUF1929)/Bacterial Ig-like domain (group 2)